MAENKPGVRIPTAVLVGTAVALLGGIGFLYLERSSKQLPPPPPPLTEEARQYVHDGNLKLSDVEMSAHEDYFQRKIVEITGKIQNVGARTIRVVEINCVFYDPYGRVVLRERVPIVNANAGGLAPGVTKTFRLPFDSLPESWNNVMPQMVIAGINFR